ncbi:MAG: hypothetical protein ACRD9W_17910 [Terriglobia bacterium]
MTGRKPRPAALNIAPQPPKVGMFRSAITEDDNRSVNVGYLSLFLIMALVLLILPIMTGAAILQTIYDEHHIFPYAELGKGAGLITVAFSTALGALGLFLVGDRKPIPQPPVAGP